MFAAGAYPLAPPLPVFHQFQTARAAELSRHPADVRAARGTGGKEVRADGQKQQAQHPENSADDKGPRPHCAKPEKEEWPTHADQSSGEADPEAQAIPVGLGRKLAGEFGKLFR